MRNSKPLKGKKLLLLGTSVRTCDMIRYAQSQGVHVIVTDNLPSEKSAGKQIADETWMVSTADVDKLEQLARGNNVDGVFAGVSEFNLERALTLSERLGLPFYCTRKQWNLSSNKTRFKEICRGHNIPVVEEFNLDENFKSEDLSGIKYPVIVKPADSSGWKGISVCNNENDLRSGYKNALSYSRSKEIIVEKFVVGDEISVNYTLKNGKMSLSCMFDKYFNNNLGMLPIAMVNLFPSKYLEPYIETMNKKVINLFLDFGCLDGALFLQGKVNESGFVFFEMGYRLAGSASYKFISRLNKINNMEMLINYSLTGNMGGYDLIQDNPRFNSYCCLLSLFPGSGVVGKIEGLDKIHMLNSIIDIFQNYQVGDYIANTLTLSQVILRLFIIEDSLDRLKCTIEYIYKNVKVLDDKGNNMLDNPIDVKELPINKVDYIF